MPRDAIFDLAINRALSYALKLKLPLSDEKQLCEGLEPWHLKTRFAYRIPLPEIVAILQTYPGEGFGWVGGRQGGWGLRVRGK